MFRGLKNSSIITRLGLGMGSVLACTALVAMAGWYGVNQAQERAEQLQQRTVPALKAVLGVMADTRQARLLELQLIAQRTEEARRAQEMELLASRRAVQLQMQSYRPLDLLDQQHGSEVTRATLAYWAAQDQVLAASRRALEGTASPELAAQLSQGPSLQTYTALSQALDAWRLHGDQVAEASGAANPSNDPDLSRLIAVSLLAVVVVAAVTMLKMSRAIIGPLHQAMNALRKLGDGEDFRVKIRRSDEFGRLLGTIDDLREVMVPMSLRDEDDVQEQAQVLEVRAPIVVAAKKIGTLPNTSEAAAGAGAVTKQPEWAPQRLSIGPAGSAA